MIVVEILMGKKRWFLKQNSGNAVTRKRMSLRVITDQFGAIDKNMLRHKLTAHRVSWPEEDSSNGMVTLLVNSVAIWTR